MNENMGVGTIFITGISASGKSTMGKNLYDNFINNDITNVTLLDGEDVREQLKEQGKEYGYSLDDRHEVIKEISRLARKYNDDGKICIICSICHEKNMRNQMHEIIGNVMEVYLECPVQVCAERDYKGNYEKAFDGEYDNFPGVTEPYQISDHVDLVLHTGKDSITECSESLFKEVVKRFSFTEIAT